MRAHRFLPFALAAALLHEGCVLLVDEGAPCAGSDCPPGHGCTDGVCAPVSSLGPVGAALPPGQRRGEAGVDEEQVYAPDRDGGSPSQEPSTPGAGAVDGGAPGASLEDAGGAAGASDAGADFADAGPLLPPGCADPCLACEAGVRYALASDDICVETTTEAREESCTSECAPCTEKVAELAPPSICHVAAAGTCASGAPPVWMVDEGRSCGEGCACGAEGPAEAECALGSGDEDDDGAFDCEDADCRGEPCDEGPLAGCWCGLFGPVELDCRPGSGDDDQDGRLDCADPDCELLSCGQDCRCEGGLPTERDCMPGSGDEDRDGEHDCEDADCRNQPCGEDGAVCDDQRQCAAP